MEVVEYRITEGSTYTWNCYGTNAYRLDSWNGEQEGYSVSIVFDTQTQEVYETTAYDYERNRAYRLMNPDYVRAHDQEARDRNVNAKEAWDDVEYTDLETEEDFLSKARAIIAGEDYDTRVSVPLTLPDDEMFRLMMMAHERDITLNQLVEQAIRAAIEEEKIKQDLEFLWT